MKKAVKRILIISGIVVGIFIIVSVIMFINVSSQLKLMTPAETHAINDSVYCIKDRFVNAYVFRGESGYLMVDAGMSPKIIESGLNHLGISADKITTVLLTHADGDHLGSLELFPNANIYFHSDEEQMVNGETAKMGPKKYKWEFGPYKMFGSKEEIFLEGLYIKVLHTPGHTPGSTCFNIGDDYLVTGDNLQISEGSYTHFYERFNMDTEQQEESLKSLPDPDTFK